MASEASRTAKPKTRRRWLQYSLRTLLLLMVPVACVAAWLGAEYEKGRRQYAAIAWVEEMGGEIGYDFEATQNDWRRRWLGDWFPERVWYVLLEHEGVIDLEPLAEFEHLTMLGVAFGQVSDFSPLSQLRKLERVDLAKVDASGLESLAELHQLKQLVFYYPYISDEQLQALQESLPHCEIHKAWLGSSPMFVNPTPSRWRSTP